MTLRFQRLLLILFTVTLLMSAVLLILYNSKQNIVFFYTPSELIESNHSLNEKIRIGGFVKKNSFKTISADTYKFIITDNIKSINVDYKGILPDLFREEQGVVIEGKLLKPDYVKASIVYAKHDENYMPKNIKNELEKKEYWNKEYK